MLFFKLQGLERTGTNYIKHVMERNFACHVLSNLFFEKHGRICEDPSLLKDYDYKTVPKWKLFTDINDIEFLQIKMNFLARRMNYLIVFKEPNAWLRSFLKMFPLNRAKDCLLRYNALYGHYLDFYRQNRNRCWLVYYEAFMKTPLEHLESVEQRFGLTRLHDDLDPIVQNRMKMGFDVRGDFNLDPKNMFDTNEYQKLAQKPRPCLRPVGQWLDRKLWRDMTLLYAEQENSHSEVADIFARGSTANAWITSSFRYNLHRARRSVRLLIKKYVPGESK
jgi:hypothetical protein